LRVRQLLTPLVYLSSNFISLTGVVVVTTATILWLFLLPSSLRGGLEHPYLGILAYLALPALFLAGLLLIPFGIWLQSRRLGRQVEFPPLDLTRPELRRLLIFILVTTVVNVALGSQFTYQAVSYMDSNGFCGQTCHKVMQPEYTAHGNAAHSSVECVRCHIGPGASSFVQAKLSGVRQLIGVTTDSFHRPIEAPVENMRPAHVICGECHSSRRNIGDRLRVIAHYSDGETAEKTHTVLLMRVGGDGRGIHGAHMGDGVSIRYGHKDRKRQEIPWVQYSKGGVTKIYAAKDAPADGSGLTMREMDCLDCHNRPSHTFEMAESATDRAIAAGTIDSALPYVRKQSVEVLKGKYATQEEAAQKIQALFAAFYREKYPDTWAKRRGEIENSARAVLGIWERNVFPQMKIEFGTYVNNSGHTDSPGCFRCHDESHATKEGQAISQDCNSCHQMLAVDEKSPQVLETLGIQPAR
jgi:hypothetical protein